MQFAPVAIFAFNRPEHLRRTLASLAANDEAAATSVTIYCDGARSDRDLASVAQVRSVAQAATGFADLILVERAENWGLARSIISGVTQQIETHGRLIVLEDDMEVSPYFLRYMNQGLQLYADDEAVASIHGYIYPLQDSLPETFFLRGADCWGWATWQRAWRHFNPDAGRLLAELRQRELLHRFDFEGSFPYSKMLSDNAAGLNNSWAIRWYASCFLHNLLTLYPGRSLVNNIGVDGSGTHCSATDVYQVVLNEAPVSVSRLPLREHEGAHRALADYFRRQSWRASFVRRLVGKLKSLGRRAC